MRKILVSLLTCFLSIALMFNFARFTFSDISVSEDFTSVSIFTIVDSISTINVDNTAILDDYGDALSILSNRAEQLLAAITPHRVTGRTILSSIISFFDIIIGIINDVVPLSWAILRFAWHFLAYMAQILHAFFRILNILVGFDIDSAWSILDG